MKIIITNTFRRKFMKKMQKYFSTSDLVNTLKNKEEKMIILHKPFLKIKNPINSIAIRGVVVLMKDNELIPLSIYLKKDKTYGENIVWENMKKKIYEEFKLTLNDIQDGNYEEF